MQRYPHDPRVSMQTVFSTEPSPQWPGELQRLAKLPRREPFAADALALVGTLSQRILRSELARRFPELAALAHWFRPASLRVMAERLQQQAHGARVRPRGVVFAMAPGNVDVLFIYAWLLSLLTGNATVVRVSGKPSLVRDTFIALVLEIADEPAHAAVLADSWVITYDHDLAHTRAISEVCHARLVWGGDATITAVRAIYLNPIAVEICFADRFSLAAFDAATVLAQADDAVVELARRFANDTLWFAQQACSSPRAVIWIGGDADIAQAQARFWPRFVAAAQAFADEPSAAMCRVTDLFSLAALGAIDALGAPPAQLPARASGMGGMDLVRGIHSGYGMFIEYRVARAADVAGFVRETDQTLVAYGITGGDLDALIGGLPNRAIDRIVAPGQATEFSTVWDGTDLFDVLTRKINLSA